MAITGLVLLAILAGVAFVAKDQLMGKRPTVLGTSVRADPLHPVIFTLQINDQQIAAQRSKALNDGGEAPYKNRAQTAFDIDLTWIELLTQNSYRAQISVEGAQLSRFDAKGSHADLGLALGPNGALEITTSHPMRLQYLRQGKDDLITPEMDIPLVLAKTCADPIAKSDPQQGEMALWLDENTRARETAKRAEFIANNPDYRAPDPCA